MAKKFRIPGVSFSWKRALGLSQAKQKLSRKIGIPLSRGGLERRLGRMLLKGCSPMLCVILTGVLAGVVAIVSRTVAP